VFRGFHIRLLQVAIAVAILGAVPAAALASGLPPVEHGALPVSVRVPAIGVEAPVVVLGLEEDGAMENPEGPTAAGWYTFSATPGNPGNAVFSGHRDWRTGATGVFWRLDEVVPGDTIAVELADGTELAYAVLLNVVMAPDQMPIEEVVGQTSDEIITLITCAGTFDAGARDYDQRRVVWAARVA
jgi:LPXTG-site transpeptidase (sortase) family protein